MIVYRPITLDDVDGVTALAMRALAPSMAVPLRLDPAKVESMVRGFALTSAHYQMAAFEGAKPVGGICAYVVDAPLYERGEAHVAMCFAEKAGAGCTLINMMLKALSQNPSIMRICWMMNDVVEDPVARKFGEMLRRRYGFVGRHENLVRYTHTGG